mmetsp:Transcript_77644/g.216998  ORF Transcript_77644/g.216998 Transcript_77644/m.216998 type:complete len:209 (+) Transcript_77644:61-687(+)
MSTRTWRTPTSTTGALAPTFCTRTRSTGGPTTPRERSIAGSRTAPASGTPAPTTRTSPQRGREKLGRPRPRPGLSGPRRARGLRPEGGHSERSGGRGGPGIGRRRKFEPSRPSPFTAPMPLNWSAHCDTCGTSQARLVATAQNCMHSLHEGRHRQALWPVRGIIYISLSLSLSFSRIACTCTVALRRRSVGGPPRAEWCQRRPSAPTN